MSSQTLIVQHPASGGADSEQHGKPQVVVEMLTGDTAGIKAAIPLTSILVEHCKDMFLGRFSVPRAARYRLYVDARLDRDADAAVAVETTPPPPTIASSPVELSSRLKRLCPLHVVGALQQCPAGTRLRLDFADYLAVCGSERRNCRCDERADRRGGDVSMGGDSAACEQLLIGECDVIAESRRSPVRLSTSFKPRHCDVTASSRDSLLMTSLGLDVIYVVQSDASVDCELGTSEHFNADGMLLKRWTHLPADFDQPFTRENGFDIKKFLCTISELIPWLEEWLDKERVGRHDDGCDAGSAAAASRSEDELATCPQTSSVDTGEELVDGRDVVKVDSSQLSPVDAAWNLDSQDDDSDECPRWSLTTNSSSENGDILAGAVKSKAVSCPMVLKNWSSEPSDARVEPSGSSEAVGSVKLPLDAEVADSAGTAAAYPPVFERWDSTESDAEDADAVAVATGEYSADVSDVRTPDSKEAVGSWDSAAEDWDAVATTMEKDVPDMVDSNDVVTSRTGDSEDDEDVMNRNAREKHVAGTEPTAAHETDFFQMQFVANQCACNFPGVNVEWCPDPFQLVPKRTGDVTEPETWESDSGEYSEGYARTPSMSSIDDHRRRGAGEAGCEAALMNSAVAAGQPDVDEDAVWKARFDEDLEDSQPAHTPNITAQPRDIDAGAATDQLHALATTTPDLQPSTPEHGAGVKWSSTPDEVHVKDVARTTDEQDPDAIELLLDASLESGASGDAVSSSTSPWIDDRRARPPRLWQRIRRRWSEFRLLLARRFSRVFGRGRHRARASSAAVSTQ